MHTCLHRIPGLVVVALVGAACAGSTGPTIKGNGQNQIEDRQVSAFDTITVLDALTAMITLAPDQPQSVRVSGDSNLLPLVRTTVSGTTLTLELVADGAITQRIPLVVTVSAQALHALRADNVARAIASAVSGGDVSVESSNSASVTVASITATKTLTLASDNVSKLVASSVTADGPITLKAAHSGQLEATGITASQPITLAAEDVAVVAVSGTAPMLMARLTRSATLRGQQLSAAAVVINASNVSSAQVCATTSLDATLTTSSQVVYHCNPDKVARSVDPTSALTRE